MTTVEAKRGDIGVLFTDTPAAVDVDFTDVATALFLMKDKRGVVTLVSGDATTSNEATGSCDIRYVTQDGDLDVAGLYRQEWELTFGDGSVLTFPSRGWNEVIVTEDLNP
jgi:hypothetical protein